MIETQDVAPNKDSRIAFVGDFAFPFSASAVANADSVKEITGADVVVGNLESAMVSQDKQSKLINLYSTASLRAFMAKQGIRIVSLANNHVMDFGDAGLRELLSLLQESNVSYCGAGTDWNEATRPLELQIGQKRWLFISYAWPLIEAVPARNHRAGIAPLNRDLMLGAIQELREKNDGICMLCHWGYEYEKFPLPAHRRLAHMLIDAGATVIIGHHPHVIQGIEYYKGKMIAYSLGNFFLPLESYRTLRATRHKGKHIGLVIKYDPASPRKPDLFAAEYDPATRGLTIRPATDHFLTELRKLSQPLEFSDDEYADFFRKNRVRRKLLPVMTGGRLDAVRSVWLRVRGQGVQFAVRLLTAFNRRTMKKTDSDD
jgi:poly-gamma-glutamate synthesis protein (capsule biosynthesis protein)